MPTPSTRTPIRVARGTYSNLNSSIADIQEGEICYATNLDKLYVKESGSLVEVTGAPLASPTFTGTPAAPTAAAGTNTTQIATTAYVQGESFAKTNVVELKDGKINEFLIDPKIFKGSISVFSSSFFIYGITFFLKSHFTELLINFIYTFNYQSLVLFSDIFFKK